MQKLTALFATMIIGLSACQPSTSLEAERSGDWSLNPEQSSLNYITIKNSDVAENNRFRKLSGTVTKDGTATFNIHLDSVDTDNEIRDPRLREHLFKTQKFPLATASAQLDMAAMASLPIGERYVESVSITLDLHGVKDERDVDMRVTRLGPNKVLVEPQSPILIEAYEFELEPSLEILRKLAGLDSITPVVPVTFSLVFER